MGGNMGTKAENNHNAESGSKSTHTISKQGGEGDRMQEATRYCHCQGAKQWEQMPTYRQTNSLESGLLHSGNT